jgi:hypothetical protein
MQKKSVLPIQEEEDAGWGSAIVQGQLEWFTERWPEVEEVWARNQLSSGGGGGGAAAAAVAATAAVAAAVTTPVVVEENR